MGFKCLRTAIFEPGEMIVGASHRRRYRRGVVSGTWDIGPRYGNARGKILATNLGRIESFRLKGVAYMGLMLLGTVRPAVTSACRCAGVAVGSARHASRQVFRGRG